MITVQRFRELTGGKYSNLTDDNIKFNLDSIEDFIRTWTNNDFADRRVRFRTATENYNILGITDSLQIGDTIMISQSINDGIYRIVDITDFVTTVDKQLYRVNNNLIALVRYPPTIIKAAIAMFDFDINQRDKVSSGVSSEKISRWTVSYGSNNNADPYPKNLLEMLQRYVKLKIN